MKTNILIVGLVTLLIGLFVGYNLTPNPIMGPEMMEEAHDELEDDMHYEDGFMQHSMEEMMRGLRGKTGEDFEKSFLEMMIVHHVGAIEMAEELLEQTNRPELEKMGNDIISVQTQEVEMMETWLSEWFNEEDHD